MKTSFDLLGRLLLLTLCLFVISGCASAPPSPIYEAWAQQNRTEFYRLLKTPDTPKADKDLVFEHSLGSVDSPVLGPFSFEVFQALKPQADLNASRDILILRAASGPRALQLVHDLGINLNRADGRGITVIHHIVYAHNIALLEKAVKLGVQLDQQNNEKMTPLLSALLNWMDDPDQYKDMATAVQNFKRIQVMQGEEMAKALISNGANVNARVFDDQRTALLQAALQNRPDVVRYLISVGADIRARDLTGDDFAAYIELGRKKAEFKEEKNQQAAAKARANRALLGNLFKTTVAAGVIGASSISSENKVRIFGAAATDIATNGEAQASQNVQSQLQSSRPGQSANPASAGRATAAGVAPVAGARATASTPANTAVANASSTGKRSYPGLPKINNVTRSDFQLNANTVKSWCERETQAVRNEFTKSEDDLISIGACKCNDVSMTKALQSEHGCQFVYAYQQNVPNYTQR
jgi:hypothetical protein